jgi:hypothetical protein
MDVAGMDAAARRAGTADGGEPGSGSAIDLHELIAMRVPGWTATASSGPSGAHWEAQDPDATRRAVRIEEQLGDVAGDVTVIGTTALGIAQRILLPTSLGEDRETPR